MNAGAQGRKGDQADAKHAGQHSQGPKVSDGIWTLYTGPMLCGDCVHFHLRHLVFLKGPPQCGIWFSFPGLQRRIRYENMSTHVSVSDMVTTHEHGQQLFTCEIAKYCISLPSPKSNQASMRDCHLFGN